MLLGLLRVVGRCLLVLRGVLLWEVLWLLLLLLTGEVLRAAMMVVHLTFPPAAVYHATNLHSHER